MGRLVILKLKGSFESGFQVTLEIGSEGSRQEMEVGGELPVAQQLVLHYSEWQASYLSLESSNRAIKAKNIVYSGSLSQKIRKCNELSAKLCQNFNSWLRSESFMEIREKWLEKVPTSEEVRVLISTSDFLIRKLPWHRWEFLERYPNMEVALSAPRYELLQPNFSTGGQVKILAILGNSQGINIKRDREFLERLPQATVVLLQEPTRQSLSDRLWETWDILFFAGHSQTEAGQGRIFINPTDSLTIDELKEALKKTVNNGLQLAIFNSCDGLGLAQQLEQLHVPQIVVMREPVPDRIAQEFLKYFLEGFSRGKPLYQAVREARSKLQALEDCSPCASWLPIICQNPATAPPTWQSLSGVSTNFSYQNSLRAVLTIGTAVAFSVMVMRLLGFLQGAELKAFDWLMRLRPSEPLDRRILIITIDEQDIEYQAQRKMKLLGSLSNQALVELAEKLKPHNPRVIGLDIYRDRSDFSDPYHQKAVALLQSDRFISICKIGDPETDTPDIRPMPEIPLKQVGFSDIPIDPDLVVRRQFFGMAPPNPEGCYNDNSFSFQLAYRYLGSGKKEVSFKYLPENRFLIGDRIFQKSRLHTAAYHRIPSGGFAVMLNYRSSQEVARKISLREILSTLSDAELADLVTNRIVLIGTVDKSYADFHLTPYGAVSHPFHETPGVEIQAHMISQITSAVLDNRPVLWWLPQWGDALWIWMWSLLSGASAVLLRGRVRKGIVVGAGVVSVCLASFLVLWQWGLWLPLVPAVLAVLGTVGVTIKRNRYDARRR